MGSPEFSLPTLEKLAFNYKVVGLVTQPDRPAGRGRNLKPSPVKEFATELGIPFIQPRNLRQTEAIEKLVEWEPDMIVVAAFGQILRQNVLDLPTLGCINVHASLLPRWRGAAPIPATILHGDPVTGTTVMIMDAGIDTGPMLSQQEISTSPQDTTGSLNPKLASLGASLLIETLPGYMSGTIQPIHQDEIKATHAPMLSKGNGELNFSEPAVTSERKVRAYNPWPGAFMIWNDSRLKIHRSFIEFKAGEAHRNLSSGTRTTFYGLPAVKTEDHLLILEEVQPSGKNRMPGEDFLRGTKNWVD